MISCCCSTHFIWSRILFPPSQERQRAAAAVHIQRVARGRVARKLAASVSISHDVSVPPLPPIRTPPTEAENYLRDGEKEDGGLSSSPAAADGNDEDNVAAESAEDGEAEALAPPDEDSGNEYLEGVGTVPTRLSAEVGGEEKLLGSANGSPASAEQEREPSPVVAISKAEEAARARAASKIQVRGLLCRFGSMKTVFTH